MQLKTLNIYGIHTQHLTIRAERFHDLLQKLRVVAIKCGYHVKIRLIIKPDVNEIQDLIKKTTPPAQQQNDSNQPPPDTRSEFEKRVQYIQTGDPDFDNNRTMFSMEMISNFEKHRAAWKHIVEGPHEEGDLHMIIEDDSYLLPDGIDTWKTILNSHSEVDWDLMILGLAHLESKETFTDIRKFLKVLPSKDAYLITPDVAKKLYADDKFRYILRIQLSQYIYANKEIRVVCPNKRFLLDGSKLGISPSSVHTNNLLIFNNEYVTMLKGYQQQNINDKTMREITAAYKSVEHINSPEVTFIMAKIQEKLGNLETAKELCEKAFKQMKAAQGIVNGRSDIVSTVVDICAKHQPDIPKIKSKPSKYNHADASKSDF